MQNAMISPLVYNIFKLPYNNYVTYLKEHPEAQIVEMDTVEGIKGGKVLLTFLLRNCKLMLAYIFLSLMSSLAFPVIDIPLIISNKL